jgi:hypothetical protein
VLQGRALVQAPERVQGLSAVRVPVLAAVQLVRVRVPALVLVLVRPEQVPERVPAEPLWAADRRRNRQWRWRE